MVPPTLAAHLDLVAGGWFAPLSKRSQLIAVGHQAAGIREASAEGERDSDQVVALTYGAGFGQRCCVVMSNPSQLRLGVADVFLFPVTGFDSADGALTGQPIADDCSTFFFTPTRHIGQGTHDRGGLPFRQR